MAAFLSWGKTPLLQSCSFPSLKVFNPLNGNLKIIILQCETGLKYKYIKESIEDNELIHLYEAMVGGGKRSWEKRGENQVIDYGEGHRGERGRMS